MKKFIATVMISLTLFQAVPNKSFAGIGTDKQTGAAVGPFAVTDSFCQNFSKMGALLNAFQIVQWPVAGFPGVVMGLTQRTSVIHDICSFLTQLEQLDGVNAVFFAADYLNELTGKKWDHHLKFAKQTWDLANSVYDFDEGGMRPGALTSESTARDMNDWMEEAYHWHGKTFNNEEVYVKHRQEREQEMQQFAQLSYKKATLEDASKCPKPQDDNTNYAKIYEKQVKPYEVKRDETKDDVDFYKQQLYFMGPKFMNNEGDLKIYITQLEAMMRDGVSYKMVEADVTKETYKPTGEKDTEDNAVLQKTKVKRKAFLYSAATDAKPFNDFKTKWNDQWSGWVTAQWSSQGSFGALTGDGAARVEADFKDINYECQAGRITRGLNTDAPDFDKQRDRLIKQCQDNVTMNQKKSQNLLDYYSTQLQQSLYNFKSANAQIWTAESKYAGINRLLPVKGNANSNGSTFQEDGISCSDNLSEAEMTKLQVQQQVVNNGLTEVIAKESIKQSTIKEAEQLEVQSIQEENQRKQVMADSKNKDLQKASMSVGQPFSVKSSTW